MALNLPGQAGGGDINSPESQQSGQETATPKRRRVTQRLVLGGKSSDADAASAHSGGIRLPGASAPTVDAPAQGEVHGEVQLTAYELLQSIPAEFLTADHETLFNSEQAQQEVPIPLKLILPGLPSGKIEIPILQLTAFMPEGMVKSEQELGEYAQSPVKLSLQDIIPRIPEEYMVLRYDQKPIDNSVTDLEDPFSLEALQAAALEKQEEEATALEEGAAPSYEEAPAEQENVLEQAYPEPDEASAETQAPEAEVSGEEVDSPYHIDAEMQPTMPMGYEDEAEVPAEPEPVASESEEAPDSQWKIDTSMDITMPVPRIDTETPPQEQEPAPGSPFIDPGMDPTVPMESQAPEEAPLEPAPGTPFIDPEMDPTVPMGESESGGLVPEAEEADLSFTKTEAFKQFMAENDEGDEPPETPEFEPGLAVTEIMDSVEDKPVPAAANFPPPEEVASRVLPEVPEMIPAPPVKFKGAEAPPKFHFRAPGASQESNAQAVPGPDLEPEPEQETQPEPESRAKPTFRMPTLGKAPVAPDGGGFDSATEQNISKTSKMSSPAAQAVVHISDSLRSALRLSKQDEVTLRDIVHQINCWPGMEGCILGGKDGLTITSEIEDERFGNSLSAFAPKILSRLNELFQDLGFEQVEELQTPMDTGSIFIFRFDELFLIALSKESAMPASYRLLIKNIITELAKQKTT
jgi:predicted regulator of Ras-like GTPase activity (Roadblock/LC7/MglB family)